MQKNITRRHAVASVFVGVAAPASATRFVAEAIQDGATAPQGYGNCAECACPGYTGNAQVCQNCGHNYRAHW
jgi:hypothetical protein